jgi:hypothetical protein
MIVIYVRIVGIPMCHIFPCIILVTRDLGRTLESFTSCLACQVWGEPRELVNIFVEFVSPGDPSRRMFDDGAGIHEYSLFTILDCGSPC